MKLTQDSGFQAYSKIKLAGLSNKSIQAVLELKAEGATVPFMARYRKEKTGNLDEVQIRAVIHESETWAELVSRKEFVITEIAKQGSLTDDLKKQIETSYELNEIEELYRPYKKKKKTKAKIALDAGLGPLAEWISVLGFAAAGAAIDKTSLEVKAKEFIKPDSGFATYEEVLRGAQHIIVEKLSNRPELRTLVKNEYSNNGRVVSAKTKEFKPNSKFSMYAEFSEPIKSLMSHKSSHRYLALRRGWQEGELKVSIEANDAELLKHFENALITNFTTQATEFLKESSKIALTVHTIPSVVNELHGILKEKSDADAINVFAENVRRVLLGSPFGAKVVLGVDPGLRTGCKIALIDKSGKFVTHTLMQILGDDAKEKAKKLIGDTLTHIKVDAIAVGNGTAGRETEKFVREILKELNQDVPVVLVNESGASVYSASEVAREEFPELDLTVRGAISIARRLQDPLAELVKIDPKSIGVGQYQHDVGQTQLKKSLHEVVESCVNKVGVDVNTASESLLQYVSGIGPAIAKNIVKYRSEKGLFHERSELDKVPHLSSKVYELSAGFLRIPGGRVPLDSTGIHPERYSALKDMLHEAGVSLSQALSGQLEPVKKLREKWVQLIGEFTFDDIVSELAKPGRDPRDPYKIFKFREDIHEIKDLEANMICPGIVTNVTNFGAFVDVGVHQDGLVHISQLTHDFVEDPRLVVNPGDQVTVKVLAVDKEKKQISFTMKLEERPPARAVTQKPAKYVAPKPQQKFVAQSKDSQHQGGQRSGRDQTQRDARDQAQHRDQRPRDESQNRDQGRPNQGPRRDNRNQRDNRGSNRDQGHRERQKPAFNNPFAALADLTNLKK